MVVHVKFRCALYVLLCVAGGPPFVASLIGTKRGDTLLSDRQDARGDEDPVY